jgi:hypothetical protein
MEMGHFQRLKKSEEARSGDKKNPLICQAGSAEAFLYSIPMVRNTFILPYE